MPAPYDLISNETLYNISQGGHVLLQYSNDVSGGALFITWLIAIVWFAVSGGIFMYQKRNTNNGDLAMAFAVGGFVTTILTILLGFIPNLVPKFVYIAVIFLTSLGVLVFLGSKNSQY